MSTPSSPAKISRAAKTSRAESQAATRERLIETAERLIVTESIPALSLRRLCAEAGFTQGAFYSNFASKEALLLEVMERHLDKQYQRLAAVERQAAGSDPDTVFAAVANWLGEHGQRREWAALSAELRLQAFRDPEFGKQLNAADRRITAKFASLIDEMGAEIGMKPVIPSHTVAETMFGIWYSIMLREPEKIAPEKLFVTVLRRMMEGRG